VLAAGGIALAVLVVQHLLWPAPAGIVIQGALIGGLTALVSIGIVLVYRANRIINFAQGDLGALPASLAVLLIVSSGLNYFLALAVGLASAVLLGVAVETVIIRRFFRAPRLILSVATIGLAQVLAAGGLLLPRAFRLSVPPQNYPAPFRAALTLGGVTFRGNDLLAMMTVPLVIVTLGWWLQCTTLGSAVRACADDPDRASLLGINVKALHTVVWVVATLISTVALFLRAGVVGLPLGTVLGPGILLRALAACVIGRMDDLPVVTAAAVGLGIVEQAVVHHTGQASYVDPVLFVVILGALLLDGQRRRSQRPLANAAPDLAAREVPSLPPGVAGRPGVRWARRVAILLTAAVLAGLPLVLPESRVNLIGAGVIFAVIGLSLVVLTGWAGQISLGQMAFVGIGAAVGGWITTHVGADLTVAVVVAGAVGAALALVIGLPALRLGGLELAVTTLAFALATSSYLLNPKFIHWLPTGRVLRRPVLGLAGVASETRFYEITLIALALALIAVSGLRHSRTGRALIATRENRAAAEAYGINTTTATLTAFAVSGFLAAAAGALFVHHQQSLGTSAYAPAESLAAFTMVVVGGLGSVPGVLLGAAYVRGADWFLPSQYRILATGVGLLGVLLLVPEGLGSLLWRARDALLGLRPTGPPPTGPPPTGPPTTGASPTGSPPTGSPPTKPRPSQPPPPAADAKPVVLQLTDLKAGYGRTTVLEGITLAVHAGEIMALVGNNGSGKSTLLRAISGLGPRTAGRITVGDRDVSRWPPHRIAAAGIGHLAGGRGVFASLTVADNLALARRYARRHGTFAADTERRLLAAFPVLVERSATPAGLLSGGEQQMLALAMVLLGQPRVLLLDELSLGLSPAALARLLPFVSEQRQRGASVIIVEQSLAAALDVADSVCVIQRGRVTRHAATSELASSTDLLPSVFLGPAAERLGSPTPRPTPPPPRTAVLEVNDVTCRFGGVTALADVSVTLAEGEILGLVGANGAGKTTLLDAVSGLVPIDQGTIQLSGRDITHLATHRRAALGLGRSWQDGRLFPALTVADTIAVALELHLSVRDPVAAALHLPDVRREEAWTHQRATELIDLLRLGAYAHRGVDELSTGTRRLVDLACVLAQQPRVVLFDEPSSGLAQAETDALGPLLQRVLAETRASFVVVEHDVALLTSIATRIVALDLGRIIAQGAPDDVVRDPSVIAAYLGTPTAPATPRAE